MLDRLFGWGKKRTDQSNSPDIPFGRYSDNNKPVAKAGRWNDADKLFKEKKYGDSFDAFFEYLRDDSAKNVVYERNGAEGRFEFYQGSKIVRGSFTNEKVNAELILARMPQPSVPVMRRLLEMNFGLYYSRFALDKEKLCMRFDSDLESANPSKLYYGLKELATKGDKQDDLLVQDFSILQTADNDHVTEIPIAEKEIKYTHLQAWIKQTLEEVNLLDADKLSGGIAYLLLSLVYRIDYLIVPEGKLLNDLERIAGIYFVKDERPVVEKNRNMAEEFKKIQARPKEEVFASMTRSRHTFSIVSPQNYKAVSDSIQSANANMLWYRDNNHPFTATQICEYGIGYCQYSYSIPRAITEFFHLYMEINYSGFFQALGFHEQFFDAGRNQFNRKAITERIADIQQTWKEKFPKMDFKVQNLQWDNLVNFDHTFTHELELLNMEGK